MSGGSARPWRRLRWFRDRWEPLGYTAEHAATGHYKVRDPDGRYVTSISSTPYNERARKFEAERILQRHEEQRGEGAGDE